MKQVSTAAGLAAISQLLLAAPALAAKAVRPGARGDKFGSVFADAGPVAKLLVLMLAALAIAALVGAVRRGAWPLGTRIAACLVPGGLLLGLAGATFLAVNILVRIVYSGAAPPFVVMAPGLAEMLMVLTVGLLASAIGAFARRPAA